MSMSLSVSAFIEHNSLLMPPPPSLPPTQNTRTQILGAAGTGSNYRHFVIPAYLSSQPSDKASKLKDVERSLSPLRDVESLRWHEKKISLVFSYFNALFDDGSCLYFFTRCLFHCLSLPCWRNLPAESCKLELCLRSPNAESRSRLTYLVYRKKTRFFCPLPTITGTMLWYRWASRNARIWHC